MFEIAQEKLMHIIRAHLAAHGIGGPRHDQFGGGDFLLGRRAMRHLGKYCASYFRRGLDDEEVAAVSHDLGQGEIETCGGFWPSVHGYAKARSARLAAVHGDDEGVLASCTIMWIDVGSTEKYLVLDCDRMKFAGAHADEGEPFTWIGLRHYADALRIMFGAPKTQQRRVQKLLP